MTIELGVDVGGTFTDVVATTGRRARPRQGAVRPRRIRPAPSSRPASSSPRSSGLGLDDLLARLTPLRPRDHRRHERARHPLGPAARPAHHRRLRGPHPARPRQPGLGWRLARAAAAARRPHPHRRGRASASTATARSRRRSTSTAPSPARDLVELGVEREQGRRGIEALVVSFLWSFRNPTNEHAVARRDRGEVSRRLGRARLGALAGHPRVRAHAVRAAERVRRRRARLARSARGNGCGPRPHRPGRADALERRRDHGRRRPRRADRARAVRSGCGRGRRDSPGPCDG